MVYAPNKAVFERGDIVLLTPPVELTQMALERGIPIRPGKCEQSLGRILTGDRNRANFMRRDAKGRRKSHTWLSYARNRFP